MKKLTLLICFSFFTISLYAQGGTREQPTQLQEMQNWSMEPRVLEQENVSEIEGSPFYNEDWQPGYVMINENSTSNTVELKYSTYTNELLFVENGKQAMALPANKFQGFVLTGGDKKVMFKNGYSSNKHKISSDQLMRVIYEGDIQLLAKEYTKLHRSEDPFTKEKEYTFFSEKDYYLRDASGSFHKVKLNDDIIDKIGANKDELKQFADSNDLDFGDEDDLAKILAHYEKSSGGAGK